MWKGNLKSPYFSASFSFGAEGEQFSKIKNKQVPKLRIYRTDGYIYSVIKEKGH
jgi:hypothetical protein